MRKQEVRHPLHTRDWSHDVTDLLEQSLTALKSDCAWSILCSSPIGRDLNLSKCSSTSVDLPYGSYRRRSGLLQVRSDLQHPSCTEIASASGRNLCKSKECGLKNRCWCAAHIISWQGQLHQSDNIDVVLSTNVALCLTLLAGGLQALCIPLAVNQESTARLDVADHLVAYNVYAGTWRQSLPW